MSDEVTRVQIKLPLPPDVLRIITRLIDSAYPEMLVEGDRESITFLIPKGAQPRI